MDKLFNFSSLVTETRDFTPIAHNAAKTNRNGV